jgi:hypothetical protein
MEIIFRVTLINTRDCILKSILGFSIHPCLDKGGRTGTRRTEEIKIVKRLPADPHQTSLDPQPEISRLIQNQYQSVFAGMMENQSGSLPRQSIF